MRGEFDPLKIGEVLREERKEHEHEKRGAIPFAEPEEPAPAEIAEEQTEAEAEAKRIRKKIRRSSVERVVGGISPKGKENILAQAEEIFDEQSFKELEGKERKKTREETQIISLANAATDELRRRYGLPDFDIPEKNFHIIKKRAWRNKRTTSFYSPKQQAVAIREREQKVLLLRTILHEMIHFKSHNAWQVVAGEKLSVGKYRVGLSMVNIKEEAEYFANLNEAITEELTKRLFKTVSDGPLFKEEMEGTIKELGGREQVALANGAIVPADDIVYAGDAIGGSVKDRVKNFFRGRRTIALAFPYRRERAVLNLLVDKLFERNKDKFKDREEIFEIFAKGAMTGNIMALGRLIEKTFGKGTLRRLGELGNDIDEQEEFVEFL